MTERDRLISKIKERWYHFVETATGDYRDAKHRSIYGEFPHVGDSCTAFWTLEMMGECDE